jgi:hypothetical protein
MASFAALACLAGASAWHVVRSTNEASSTSAISRQVMVRLPAFYEQNGRYPKDLSELRLDLAAADRATEATLRFVRYSSDGTSFTYAEVGPDEYHRRVWWCAGSGPCGFADLGK